MNKDRYEILRKQIKNVSLVSTTSQNWFDSDDKLVPWVTDRGYIGPQTGETIFNVNDDTYYTWMGSSWVSGSIEDSLPSYNLPLFLESTVDEMGVMVGFDGNIGQVDQLCNFSYTGTTGSTTITVFNTVNPFLLGTITQQIFTVDWGNGITSGLTVNSGLAGSNFPSVSHTYATPGGYTITLKLDSTWGKQNVSKSIQVPFNTSVDSFLGSFVYTGDTLPYYNIPNQFYLQSGRTQNYLNDFEYDPPTGYTTFSYLGIGGSRIEEKRQYGTTGYTNVTTGSDSTGAFKAYSFTYTGNTTGTTVVSYRDYSGGVTLITGNTTGFTKEEIINQMITRNENFLGFVDDPTVFSDIFVERGKQGVLEKTLRLSEIDNVSELDIYGNGYFRVRKQ